MRPPKKPCLGLLDGPYGPGVRCPNYALTGESRCQSCKTEFERRRRANPHVTGRRGTDAAWRRARGLAIHNAKRRCWRCSRHERDLGPGEKLEVHHVDGDPSNHRLSNLRVLCTPCHRLES